VINVPLSAPATEVKKLQETTEKNGEGWSEDDGGIADGIFAVLAELLQHHIAAIGVSQEHPL